MLGRVSASIPQGTKDYLGNASQSLFNRKHLRSLTIFFGIGEERPFYVEKSPSLLTARLKHNLQFFYLNYMVVFGILFVLTMITSFTTMIGLVVLGAAWLYVIRASADGSLKIGSKYLLTFVIHLLNVDSNLMLNHYRYFNSSKTSHYCHGSHIGCCVVLSTISYILVDCGIGRILGKRARLFERRIDAPRSR